MLQLFFLTFLFSAFITPLATAQTEAVPPLDRLQPQQVPALSKAMSGATEILGLGAQIYSFFNQGAATEEQTQKAMQSQMGDFRLALLRSGSKGALIEADYAWKPKEALDKAPKAPLNYTERLRGLRYFGDGATASVAYASGLEQAKRNPDRLTSALQPGEEIKYRRLFWMEQAGAKTQITELDEERYRTEGIVKFGDDALRATVLENNLVATLEAQQRRIIDNSISETAKALAKRLRDSLAEFEKERLELVRQMRDALAKAKSANDDANEFALGQAIASLGSVFAGELSDPPPAPPKSSDITHEFYSRMTQTFQKGREIQRSTETLWRTHVEDAKVSQGCDGLCNEVRQKEQQ